MKIGCFQIYTGDGKGKTTAALGLALRASGHGKAVYIGQFMKGQDYGELNAIPRLETVTVEQYGDPGWCYKGKITQAQIDQAEAGFVKAEAALHAGEYEIVILDELNMVIWFELISLDRVIDLVKKRPPTVELIITGRRASDELIELADLVTEMREIKHYYTQKIPARIGIEK